MATTTLRVLVVDEHPVVRQGVRALLERGLEGAEVTDAASLQGALDDMGTKQPDVTIVDPWLAGGDVEWRGGRLEPAPQSVGRGTWEFGGPIGRQRMVRYPAGEHITVPRHVQTPRVRTLLAASTAVPVPGPAASLVMAPFQLALRTPLRRAFEALIPRLPEGPSDESRRRSRFVIECEARGEGGPRRGWVSGSDPYGLTARTTVEGAMRLAAPTYDRSGALAPSQAFDAADFLDSLASAGVEYESPPAAG